MERCWHTLSFEAVQTGNELKTVSYPIIPRMNAWEMSNEEIEKYKNQAKNTFQA
jgi:hypothetical protein